MWMQVPRANAGEGSSGGSSKVITLGDSPCESLGGSSGGIPKMSPWKDTWGGRGGVGIPRGCPCGSCTEADDRPHRSCLICRFPLGNTLKGIYRYMLATKHPFTDPKKCRNETCVQHSLHKAKRFSKVREQRTWPNKLKLLTLFWWIKHIVWQLNLRLLKHTRMYYVVLFRV
jgi:hypothetical protein